MGHSFAVAVFLSCCIANVLTLGTEEEGKQYLVDLETKVSEACNLATIAHWTYSINVTDASSEANVKADAKYSKYLKKIQVEIIEKFPDWKAFKDPSTRRNFRYLSISGPGTMPDEDYLVMSKLQTEMEKAYSTATVCEYKNPKKCDLRLDPDIESKLKHSTDYDELAHYWTEWHNTMSKAVPPSKYTKFANYLNQMGKANKFKDMTELLLENYDDGNANWTPDFFKKQMSSIWDELQPHYNVLHAYVRMKLRKIPEYASHISKKGYIPAHILGNMWSQEWVGVDKQTKPFPNAPSLDATEAMVKAGYTPKKLFELADSFFTGIGLLPMTEIFWKESMLERPSDGREVVCHATAFDFCIGKGSHDFRIKQCAKVQMTQMVTAHHEMGHIEYYMHYTNQVDKAFLYQLTFPKVPNYSRSCSDLEPIQDFTRHDDNYANDEAAGSCVSKLRTDL